MKQKLTASYIQEHMTPNDEVYLQVGKVLGDGILQSAISEIEKNGENETVVINQTIEVTANELEGCVSVTVTDSNGNTFTYHRQI